MNTPSTPFDYFDGIYCINLDKRPDRWELAQKEFDKLGIKVERFSAIENNFGHHGCRDSHIGVIKLAKERNQKNILVFEDDIKMLDTNHEYYEKIINHIKDIDWHILYFSAIIAEEMDSYNEDLLIAKKLLGLHMVAYNQSIYDKVLKDYQLRRIRIIDVYFKEHILPLGKSYLTKLLCSTQRDDYSDISQRCVTKELILNRYKKFVTDQIRI